MSDTVTANYSWTKPAVGGSGNSWGGKLNTDLDSIDATVFGLDAGASARVKVGGDMMTGALKINTTGAVMPPTLGGVTLQVAQINGNNCRIQLDSFAAACSLTGRASGGTPAAPVATPAGQVLVTMVGSGNDGSFTTTPSAQIQLLSANAWSPTDRSTQMVFATTPKGSVSQAEAMRVQPSGGLTVGGSIAANDPGLGVIAAQNGFLFPSRQYDNRILNGDWSSNQSGQLTASIAAGTTATVGDCWYLGNQSGVTVNAALNPGPVGFRNYPFSTLNYAANGVAAGGYIDALQRSLSNQIYDLDSQIATLSFDIYATTSAGALAGYVYVSANTARDNGTYSSVNGPVAFTIPAGAGKVVVPLSAAMTAGMKNGAQLLIRIQQSGATGNIGVFLGSVQLEAGGVANPFDVTWLGRDYPKYYYFYEVVGSGLICTAISATTVQTSTNWRIPKRIAPSLVVVNTTPVIIPATGGAGITAAGMTVNTIFANPNCGIFQMTGFAGLTVGATYHCQTQCVAANARL